jgi:Tfp pilus assembly protein PilX
VPRPGQTEQSLALKREDGIAMLTVLMLTLILTVIGVAAITSTTLDIKMAGGERVRESTVNAAEACMSSGVQIIQQTLANGAVPSTLTGVGANPSITLPLGTALGQNPLQAEIMGQSDGNSDSADPTVASTRNAVLTISNYTVNMDIDRLYARPKSGSALQFAAGYQGTGAGAAGGGIEILYRIDCYANSTAGGIAQAAGHVTGVYACVSTGESCQRKI